jgi:hypothetical protein
MPTGLTTAWGYPVGAVGNQIKTMLQGDHPLTYENSLTSSPPRFITGQFQSPLTPIAESNLVAFGKKSRKRTKRKVRTSKKICRAFLKNKSVNPSTGRRIKRSGNTYKKLMKACKYYGLLKKKKKLQKKN